MDYQFGNELKKIRAFESSLMNYTEEDFKNNQLAVNLMINQIVQQRTAN